MSDLIDTARADASECCDGYEGQIQMLQTINRDLNRQLAEVIEAAAKIAEEQPFYWDTHTGMRQGWVKQEIARKIRALAPAEKGKPLTLYGSSGGKLTGHTSF